MFILTGLRVRLGCIWQGLRLAALDDQTFRQNRGFARGQRSKQPLRRADVAHHQRFVESGPAVQSEPFRAVNVAGRRFENGMVLKWRVIIAPDSTSPNL